MCRNLTNILFLLMIIWVFELISNISMSVITSMLNEFYNDRFRFKAIALSLNLLLQMFTCRNFTFLKIYCMGNILPYENGQWC